MVHMSPCLQPSLWFHLYQKPAQSSYLVDREPVFLFLLQNRPCILNQESSSSEVPGKIMNYKYLSAMIKFLLIEKQEYTAKLSRYFFMIVHVSISLPDRYPSYLKKIVS
ncbi:hypothetical protein ACJIZ3_025158 [Penstemon smallii]|uniref:Uncharacterized protein n=1 Tax=Penstemon smallii TaxID=265156 RepID=A0ABD3TUT9_9LAMI